MRQRQVGSSGFSVGALGLACALLSTEHGSRAEADHEGVAIVHLALDLGLTLLDTSDAVGPFTNELLVGRALESRRDEAVLATRVGLVRQPDGTLLRAGTPAHVRAACDHSLRRLRTDRIDLYQLEAVDPSVPVEETWGAMAELVAEGKVRALGLVEPSGDSLPRCQTHFPVTAIQAELSLAHPDRLDLVRWCTSHGVGFLASAPLARGVLAGRQHEVAVDTTPVRRHPWVSLGDRRPDPASLDHLRRVAERLGRPRPQVAVAWLLAQGPTVVPLVGSTRPDHLRELAAAVELTLTPEDLAELSGG